MINLLPPKEKEILFSEQKKRLAIILGMSVLIFLICLVFVLLSIYFLVSGEANLQNFSLQQATKDYQSSNSVNLGHVIQKYNMILPKIHSFYAGERYFSDAFNIVYAVQKPDGVSFADISMDDSQNNPAGNKSANNKISVLISGTSSTRADLIVFQNNLLGKTSIENVSFTPESWISSKDIDFNVKFNLNPNGK